VTIYRGNLQEFPDYTGSTFGTTQLNTLINIINKAATFYRGDLSNNLKYIKANMDAAFYESGYSYNVVIQHPVPRDFSGYTIYSDNGTNFASLTIGICAINQTWSYLVYRLYAYTGGALNDLIGPGIGKGLTSDEKKIIAQVILGVDGGSPCDCRHTSDILYRLQNVIQKNWNVLCESMDYMVSYVQIAYSTFPPQNAITSSTPSTDCLTTIKFNIHNLQYQLSHWLICLN
jgi:hypothetical protein